MPQTSPMNWMLMNSSLIMMIMVSTTMVNKAMEMKNYKMMMKISTKTNKWSW